MPLKIREITRKIEDAGWRLVRTPGGRRVFRSPDGRITVVSGRLGGDPNPLPECREIEAELPI